MNAKELLDMIQEEMAPDYTILKALLFLEDGEAMAESGITDDDQEAVEELHSRLLEEQEECEHSINEWLFDAMSESAAETYYDQKLNELAEDVENYAELYFHGDSRHLEAKKVAALLLAYHVEAIDFDDAIERLKA